MASEVTRIEVDYGMATCTLTEKDFEENTLVITASALASSGFNVGGTSMAQLSLTLTRDGLHKMQTATTLRRKAKLTVITVEKGITTKRGEFFITELKVSDYSAELTCYDGMVSFDDNLSESDLELLRNTGRTLVDLFDFCIKHTDKSKQYKVSLDTTVINGNLMNGGISFKLAKDASVTTYRNILEYASMLAGGFAYMTVDNQLSLGFFTTDVPTDTIESDRVMDYSEDAYPSIVEKVKTSIAGFDIEKVGRSDATKDGLTLAFYENPFLRGFVGENPTELPSVVTTVFDNIANKLLNTTVTGGAVNFVDNDMGVTYELGKPITVLRKVIPYNGSGATDEVESKLLVTGYTYTYGMGVSLECNASSTNINPSSAGLNKYNGYAPSYSSSGGGFGYDERLDEIAEKLETADIEFVYEGTLHSLAMKAVEDANAGLTINPEMSASIDFEPDRHIFIRGVEVDFSIPPVPSLVGLEESTYSEASNNRIVSTIISELVVSVYHKEDLKNKKGHLSIITKDKVTGEGIKNEILESLYSLGYIQGKLPDMSGEEHSSFTPDKDRNFTRSIHYRKYFGQEDAPEVKSLYINLLSSDGRASRGLRPTVNVYGHRDYTPDFGSSWDVEYYFSMNANPFKKTGGTWHYVGLFFDDMHLLTADFNFAIASIKSWCDILARSISVRFKFNLEERAIVPASYNHETLSLLSVNDKLTQVAGAYMRAIRPTTVDDIVNAINKMTPQKYTDYMWDSIRQWLTAVLGSNDRSILELKKLGAETKTLVDGMGTKVKEVESKVTVLDTSVKGLDERVKVLESKPTPPPQPPTPPTPPPEPPTPSTGSGSVFVAEHHNVLPVGVSATSKDVALFDVIIKKEVTAVLQFYATVSVEKTGTIEFTVFSDGLEMPFKPKFLLQKTLENVSFFVPLSQISKDKRVALHITGVTTDASVKIEPLGLSIAVINAELPKADDTFNDRYNKVEFDSKALTVKGITANVQSSKGV